MSFVAGGRARTAVGVIAVLGLGTAGIAVANGSADGPRTDDVTVQFTGTEDIDQRRDKTCPGQDGEYWKLKQVYTGESVGGTDRDLQNLTGTFTARTDTLINITTLEGTTRGTFEVRDPATNRKKFEGRFIGATQSTGVEGLLQGHVFDVDPTTPDSGGSLVGTFRAGVIPSLPEPPIPFIVEGDIGGNDEAPLNEPAVVQVGPCADGEE